LVDLIKVDTWFCIVKKTRISGVTSNMIVIQYMG